MPDVIRKQEGEGIYRTGVKVWKRKVKFKTIKMSLLWQLLGGRLKLSNQKAKVKKSKKKNRVERKSKL